MKIKIIKNKLAPGLNRTAEFEFVCAKGIDPYNDLISYAKDIGILRFAGSAVKINLPGQEEVTMCTGGKNGAKDHISQNSDVYTKIRESCYAFSGIQNPETRDAETQS